MTVAEKPIGKKRSLLIAAKSMVTRLRSGECKGSHRLVEESKRKSVKLGFEVEKRRLGLCKGDTKNRNDAMCGLPPF